MSIIWAILIGFVVGIIAKFLTPGKDPSGFFITAAIGVAGSLTATFLGRALGWYATGETAGCVIRTDLMRFRTLTFTKPEERIGSMAASQRHQNSEIGQLIVSLISDGRRRGWNKIYFRSSIELGIFTRCMTWVKRCRLKQQSPHMGDTQNITIKPSM